MLSAMAAILRRTAGLGESTGGGYAKVEGGAMSGCSGDDAGEAREAGAVAL